VNIVQNLVQLLSVERDCVGHRVTYRGSLTELKARKCCRLRTIDTCASP
jgi:hypothetical protein